MFADALGGQEPSQLRVGARASVSVLDSTCTRRWSPCHSVATVTGTVTRVTPDTLALHVGPAATLALARSGHQRICVSHGRSRLRAAFRNAVVDGLLPYVIADLTDASQRSTVRLASGLAAGGFALGAMLPAERWRRVTQ